jgi:Fe-S cluster assembly ATP-binding protein
MPLLEISHLQAGTEGKMILRDVTLTIESGQTVALLGPNGSGKSTLAHVLMGHPGYDVTGGTALFNGQDLLALSPEERARAGLFLSFQYPQSIAGVSIGNFLRLAYNATHDPGLSVGDFLTLLKEKLQLLGMSEEWIARSVNDGASGGEKKRAEMLQLAVLQPKLAILDETDSGLDIDALRIVGQALLAIRRQQRQMSLLVITHHRSLLEYVAPDTVAVMREGKIVAQGGQEIIQQVQQSGFGMM